MEWIKPTQHRDPQGEWSHSLSNTWNPAFAYDGLLSTMAMAWGITPEKNLEEYGDYWSGWLELYPERPIQRYRSDGVRVRLNYHKSNHYGRTHIQVKYAGEWRTVFMDLPTIHTPYWHEIATEYQEDVEGLRIRFERPQNLSGEIICFDVYGAEFYGEMTDLPEINPPADPVEECEHQWTMIDGKIVCKDCGVAYYDDDPDPEPQGKVEITGVSWGFKIAGSDATIWRPLEELGSNQGLVKIMVAWKNLTDKPISPDVEVRCSYLGILKYLQGNYNVVDPNQINAVTFEMPIIDIPINEQGEWKLDIYIDTATELVKRVYPFTVGTPYIEPEPPQSIAVWEITKGYTPHHLSDDFEGTVVLDTFPVPDKIQAVWHYSEDNEWLFWAKDAPGNTLHYMLGGEDYMVTATGDCTWEIPLGEIECGGYISISKEELRGYLETGDVADDWWEIPTINRVALAKKITQWFSVEEFGEPKYVTYSDTEPQYFPGFTTKDVEAHCGSEAGLRYALIGGQFQPPDNLWYYTKTRLPMYPYTINYEWRKAKQEKPFGLPVVKGSVNWKQWVKNPDTGLMELIPYGHIVCALQVGEDKAKQDSWVFFQFDKNDIKVGDAQMQTPGNCATKEVLGFRQWGMIKDGPERLGYWEY